MRRLHILTSVIAVILLSGCASQRVSPSATQGGLLDSARGPDENARLYTDLIRQLISQDRLYAALAHLEAREKEFGVSDELRILRADILRRMDDYENARVLYEGLLDSSFAAQANHGLGLIEARDDLAAGQAYLERAVDLAPTDARMRNDLGYALLRRDRIAAARRQLTTAYELDRNNKLNRNNYILLLLVEGNDRKAARIAADNGIGAPVMQRLENEARRIGGSGTTGATSAPPIRQTSAPQSTSSSPAVGGGGG